MKYLADFELNWTFWKTLAKKKLHDKIILFFQRNCSYFLTDFEENNLFGFWRLKTVQILCLRIQRSIFLDFKKDFPGFRGFFRFSRILTDFRETNLTKIGCLFENSKSFGCKIKITTILKYILNGQLQSSLVTVQQQFPSFKITSNSYFTHASTLTPNLTVLQHKMT